MSHESITKKEVASFLKKQEEQVLIRHRLKGGMSNSNYVVEVDGLSYTFRIPGKNAENFVSREIEQKTLDLIHPLHIDGNLLLSMDLATGYKISKFVPGTPLVELNPADYYQEAATLLQKLHRSGLKAENDYSPFERLAQYEQLVVKEGLVHEDSYFDILNRFKVYQPYLESLPKVMCHNDSQPSNFIHTEKDGLLLVDWEFGGNNDYFYDIACFGNNDFKYAEGLLPVYLGKTPQKEDWKRLYLWRTFQCLQWHNVALYKEATGLSLELHLDFKMIAANYITKANTLFSQALLYE
ncbi:MAG: phosphotransferase [Candidatus Izemoplasmatales bacterium]